MSSTDRIPPKEPLVRGPNGRWMCRCGCGREVQPPRRTFFSAECKDQWLIRHHPGYARDRVWKRDKGICARCGFDTQACRRELDDLWVKTYWRPPYRPDSPHWFTQSQIDRVQDEAWKAYCARRKQLIQEGRLDCRGHLWEANHIVPVVEGGADLGLDNLETLCLRCHKEETRKLARRRALARRKQRRFGFMEDAPST